MQCSPPMRVVFLGSPPFATSVLERVAASAHTLVGLVTPPDRPKGRGQKTENSPLADFARARSIPVLQPATTKDAEFVERLRALTPDVLLVASYGEILRRDVLELAPHGALNVHASLLPRWRGASPIQAAILAGDAETGVSVQRMVLALDEGDVLIEKRTPIDAHENAGELLTRLSILGGEAAVEALDALASGRAHFTPQDPARATYARKIEKERGTIDWTRPAEELARHVRAFTPWPGARTRAPESGSRTRQGEQELTVLQARVVADATQAPPGTLLDPATAHVATGAGALELQRVKPAGKGAMDARDWLRGARLPSGARFGA